MSDLRRITTINIEKNTFYGNTNIVNVDCNYTPWQNNSMAYAFNSCSNLKSVSNINNNITNMHYTFLHCSNLTNISSISNSVQNMIGTFYNCSSLVNAPIIPNSVTNMEDTFYNCTSLINAPIIPNSVINMFCTFQSCISLINAPNIPNSVVNMQATFESCTNLITVPNIPNSVNYLSQTFSGCTNLITVPNIPNSVNDMRWTFLSCLNLTGNIYIHSENIANAYRCFYATSKVKNVYIPFNNAGVNTKTYNSFTSAGYKTDGTVNGVYLKDLNESPTPPTPSGEIDLTGFTYTIDENNVATLTGLDMADKSSVTLPNVN